MSDQAEGVFGCSGAHLSATDVTVITLKVECRFALCGARQVNVALKNNTPTVHARQRFVNEPFSSPIIGELDLGAGDGNGAPTTLTMTFPRDFQIHAMFDVLPNGTKSLDLHVFGEWERSALADLLWWYLSLFTLGERDQGADQ